eukprot:COSAG02_NODE_3884_length_6087_cov_11.216600_4_plen_184_part_00
MRNGSLLCAPAGGSSAPAQLMDCRIPCAIARSLPIDLWLEWRMRRRRRTQRKARRQRCCRPLATLAVARLQEAAGQCPRRRPPTRRRFQQWQASLLARTGSFSTTTPHVRSESRVRPSIECRSIREGRTNFKFACARYCIYTELSVSVLVPVLCTLSTSLWDRIQSPADRTPLSLLYRACNFP